MKGPLEIDQDHNKPSMSSKQFSFYKCFGHIFVEKVLTQILCTIFLKTYYSNGSDMIPLAFFLSCVHNKDL
ncbi:hypothetical protein LDENG_00291190, partial [Lucifuga dentata]